MLASSPAVDFLGNQYHLLKMEKVLSMLVSRLLESPNNILKLGEDTFPFTMHFGVSHRRGHLDLFTSYNNYFPAQFKSKGAPFQSKRDSVLFLYSSCFRYQRGLLFDELSKLISIDSLGGCKTNKNINEEFPECAKHPRSGSSVWQQSECLFHNYKFYLAIENTQEPDYITEKLYQGLRAGSVPVYIGAPNIRDFIPENSAVFVEDFPSLEALVQYLNAAIGDETLYNKHLEWKDRPFPGHFVNSAIEKPLDYVHCQICDHIATSYGKELPLINEKGKSVVIPPCITRMLIAAETTIRRDFRPRGPSWRQTTTWKVDVVYVITVKSATERHELLRVQLDRVNLKCDLITAFDAVLLNEADKLCWNPIFTEYNYPLRREMTQNELSLAMKHTAAMFDAFQKGNNVSLVLADDVDDVYFTSEFHEVIEKALKETLNDWDFIFIGNCRNLTAVHHGGVKISDTFWRIGKSCCGHAYLVSEQGVNKALNHLPIISPMDFHISSIKNVNIYLALRKSLALKRQLYWRE